MSVMHDIADELAVKALDLEFSTGDETIIKKLGEAIAQSSPTMEETFLTAVRIRRAERRARTILAELTGEAGASPAADKDASDLPAAIASDASGPTVSFDTD